MTDDIVTMLRREYDYFNNDGVGDYELLTIAADEIERLRAERREWFLVARYLRDALIGEQHKDAVMDLYLRTRGRLEDPRE